MRRHGSVIRSIVLVACLATAGCADDSGPSSSQVSDPATAPSASSPTRTPSPATSTASTSTGGPIPVLRMADTGSELELAVGGTASIALPRSEYDWADPSVEGEAVTVSEDISDEGSTSRSWTVTAVEPGEARVGVAGSPPCRASTPPCGAPDILWSVRITVL